MMVAAVVVALPALRALSVEQALMLSGTWMKAEFLAVPVVLKAVEVLHYPLAGLMVLVGLVSQWVLDLSVDLF